MTTAQKLRAEGRLEGRVEGRLEGRVEGRIEMLIEQLTLRFGTLSNEQLETIRAGAPDQVTTWSAQLIGGAVTVDDVLAGVTAPAADPETAADPVSSPDAEPRYPKSS